MITGSIVSVSIPQVLPGATLYATVNYSAVNPGALYWKTWLVAISSVMGLQKVIDETREIGEDGGRTKTYNLGAMPSNTTAITFYLFASDNASDSFDWSAFWSWYNYGIALPDNMQRLDWTIEYAYPASPSLPDPEFANLVVTGATSPVAIGGYCTITCRWQYRGPQITKTIYGAIGNNGIFGFDEVLHNSAVVTIPEAADWTTMQGSIIIPVTSSIDPADSPYDVYVKLTGTGNDPISPAVEDIVYVTGAAAEPEFSNLVITGYDAQVEPGGYCTAQVSFQYKGPATTKTLHAAIGNNGIFGFDEILNADKSLSISASTTWKTVTASISIYIGTGASAEDSPYDIYAKLSGSGNDIQSAVLEDVITVIGEDPVPDSEFRNLIITGFTSPVAIGETCKVDVTFEYRGPAVTKTLYAAIGNNGIWGFDEILNASKVVNVAQAEEWTLISASVNIGITDVIDPTQSPYDLYAKLTGAANDLKTPASENVITIEGGGYPEPEFQNLEVKEVTSPVAIGATCWITCKYQYRGPVGVYELYAAIGNNGIFGFGEIIGQSGNIELAGAESWTDIESKIAIQITDAIDPADSPYDVYFKIKGVVSPTKEDILVVTSETGVGDISGAITAAEPMAFAFADPLDIYVTFEAYCDDLLQQLDGWSTRVTITLNGLSGEDVQTHIGRDGSRTMQVMSLGYMPEKNLSGKIILEGRGGGDWSVLDEMEIYVVLTGGGIGDEDPGEESATPWGWIALGGLGLLALSSGSSKKSKPRSKAKD